MHECLRKEQQKHWFVSIALIFSSDQVVYHHKCFVQARILILSFSPKYFEDPKPDYHGLI